MAPPPRDFYETLGVPCDVGTEELQRAYRGVVRPAPVWRLRAGLGLTFSSVGLVADLLDRIADLERRLGPASLPHTGGTPWI